MQAKPKKNWKKTLGLILIVILALSVLFLKVPVYYQARSYLVMSVASLYENSKSVMDRQNFSIKIPGGHSTEKKDWYPFVMTFNDSRGFSSYLGRDVDLSILYNFGAFNWSTGSTYFQKDSPYFNSFYGAYAVHEVNNKFAFTSDGKINEDDIEKLTEFDYTVLVLKSLGCPDEKLTMEVLSSEMKENVSYAGYDGWTQVDSLMLVNSPAHKYKGSRRAYIQYGNPLKAEPVEDFKLMTAHGRVYARFFEEFDSSILLYIITPEPQTLKECDEEILSKTVIS